MENAALVIYAGGIREITMVMGACAVPGFRDICMKCSTVLGTSAGALMGFIIACCPDAESLSRVKPAIVPHSITWWDIIMDILLGRDVITRDEIRESLLKALYAIQPDAKHRNTVTLHRDLVVGEVKHTADVPNGDGRVRYKYEEVVFKKGQPYLQDDVLDYVIPSASIIGVTTSNNSDGAQMHSFPVDYYEEHIRGQQKVFMISPYPMIEMMTPVADDGASRIVRMFYSIFYGSQMYHVGDDAREILGNTIGNSEAYYTLDYAEVYVNGNAYAVCPDDYYVANKVLSLTENERELLLKVGGYMGRALANVVSNMGMGQALANVVGFYNIELRM